MVVIHTVIPLLKTSTSKDLSFLKSRSAAEIRHFSPLPATVYTIQTIVTILVAFVREIVLSRMTLSNAVFP